MEEETKVIQSKKNDSFVGNEEKKVKEAAAAEPMKEEREK